ncbi:uncharacterized protein [Oscarella lobularis]|uniref:uncharacterized protein isoform X2 n=1 Tax=Oscarella lobularis TaxID=121494 RepID=UPI0033137123
MLGLIINCVGVDVNTSETITLFFLTLTDAFHARPILPLIFKKEWSIGRSRLTSERGPGTNRLKSTAVNWNTRLGDCKGKEAIRKRIEELLLGQGFS